MARGFLRLVLLFLLFVPIPAAAQVGVSLGAGPTFPVGSYGRLANLGWMAQGHIFLTVQERLSLLAGGFYGTNGRDRVNPEERDKSKLTAFLGGLSYRMSDPARTGPFVFWELGWLRHYRYQYAEKWIVYSAGLGLAVPVSSPVELWISGSYTGVLFDTDVALWGLAAGVRLRLTGSRY